jgi:translation initiation factor IF-1
MGNNITFEQKLVESLPNSATTLKKEQLVDITIIGENRAIIFDTLVYNKRAHNKIIDPDAIQQKYNMGVRHLILQDDKIMVFIWETSLNIQAKKTIAQRSFGDLPPTGFIIVRDKYSADFYESLEDQINQCRGIYSSRAPILIVYCFDLLNHQEYNNIVKFSIKQACYYTEFLPNDTFNTSLESNFEIMIKTLLA